MDFIQGLDPSKLVFCGVVSDLAFCIPLSWFFQALSFLLSLSSAPQYNLVIYLFGTYAQEQNEAIQSLKTVRYKYTCLQVLQHSPPDTVHWSFGRFNHLWCYPDDSKQPEWFHQVLDCCSNSAQGCQKALCASLQCLTADHQIPTFFSFLFVMRQRGAQFGGLSVGEGTTGALTSFCVLLYTEFNSLVDAWWFHLQCSGWLSKSWRWDSQSSVSSSPISERSKISCSGSSKQQFHSWGIRDCLNGFCTIHSTTLNFLVHLPTYSSCVSFHSSSFTIDSMVWTALSLSSAFFLAKSHGQSNEIHSTGSPGGVPAQVTQTSCAVRARCSNTPLFAPTTVRLDWRDCVHSSQKSGYPQQGVKIPLELYIPVNDGSSHTKHWLFSRCSSISHCFSGGVVSSSSLCIFLRFFGEIAPRDTFLTFGISENHCRTSAPTRLNIRSRGGISTRVI